MSPVALPFITVVSGVPRSGTSMMMSVLEAGGLEPMKDDIRAADEDNPRGYYELELVKKLKVDAAWVDRAVGKVVKVVHAHLRDLPRDRHRYRVVLMRRDMTEVLRSQRKMLERRGVPGGKISDERAAAIYSKQLAELEDWMRAEPAFDHIAADYNELVRDPGPGLRAIHAFLGGTLDLKAMHGPIDPTLYRSA